MHAEFVVEGDVDPGRAPHGSQVVHFCDGGEVAGIDGLPVCPPPPTAPVTDLRRERRPLTTPPICGAGGTLLTAGVAGQPKRLVGLRPEHHVERAGFDVGIEPERSRISGGQRSPRLIPIPTVVPYRIRRSKKFRAVPACSTWRTTVSTDDEGDGRDAGIGLRSTGRSDGTDQAPHPRPGGRYRRTSYRARCAC